MVGVLGVAAGVDFNGDFDLFVFLVFSMFRVSSVVIRR